MRHYRYWRGPAPARYEEQIANAPDDLFPLAPVSAARATQTRTNWSALLPDQDVPLIGEERRYGYEEHPGY